MPMETMLVRLKAFDPRRGHVLRRFVYKGIRFQVERGWYRVPAPVAEHLRTVRQVDTNLHAPAAFDVCTDAEAQRLDAEAEARARAIKATDPIPVTTARAASQPPGHRPAPAPAATTAPAEPADDRAGARRPRRDKE
jgi:hypothetical protein